MNGLAHMLRSEESTRIARDNDIRFENDFYWLTHYRSMSEQELSQEWERLSREFFSTHTEGMRWTDALSIKHLGGLVGFVLLLGGLGIGLNNVTEGFLPTAAGGVLIFIAVRADKSRKDTKTACQLRQTIIEAVRKERDVTPGLRD